MNFMAGNIIVKEDLLTNEKYKFIFSVERVNQLVLEGFPFREAYKIVGEEIESGKFGFEGTVKHTHEGSIGNLKNDAIKAELEKVIKSFSFDKIRASFDKLLS